MYVAIDRKYKQEAVIKSSYLGLTLQVLNIFLSREESMDVFFLILAFIVAVIIHMVLTVVFNEEIKKCKSGGYLIVMVDLMKRPELKLKLTAASFFAVIILAALLIAYYSR